MKKELVKTQNNERNEKIDLFWKAREFKPWEKSVDWYWIYWITVFSFIGILIYFYNDYIFSTLIFLIATISVIGHNKEPAIIEYRINNNSIILNNGQKEILFENILEYNIDYDSGLILINTKDKFKKLITVPFEATHNVNAIDKILSLKIKKNEELRIPFLEKLFEKMLGF